MSKKEVWEKVLSFVFNGYEWGKIIPQIRSGQGVFHDDLQDWL